MEGKTLGEKPNSSVDLTDLRFARFQFHLRAREKLFLPLYKGSTLRGGFGQVFRSIACLGAAQNFDKCLLGALCPYHYIFETPPPANSDVLDKIPTAPQPFILEPPLEEKRIYEPGEALIFHLVLIGKALDYLPYFIYAFDELGRIGLGRGKGTYTLASVAWLDAPGAPTSIYDGESKRLTNSFHTLTIADLSLPTPPQQLTINFLTPTRLRYENHLAVTCEFHMFFRNLARRLALLRYFHCDGEFPPEQRAFMESARAIETITSELRWSDWERYSNRQQTRMRLGGFVGYVTYRGNFASFLPYLRLGEYTHVGKGATFGLGKYQLNFVSHKESLL